MDATVLLLHGLGATGAVWNSVRQELEQRGVGRCIAPDLSGHGGSPWRDHYSVGQLAAETSEFVRGSQQLFVIGHSLGAFVGLALASGWFGVTVDGVLGVGPKTNWTAAELESSRQLASRPVKYFASEADAWARYRKASGLSIEIAAEPGCLSRGIVKVNDGWRLSQDPRTFGVAGAPFSTLATAASCRVVLARGEHDQMVSSQDLSKYGSTVEVITGAGHNTHVEKPGAIVTLLEQLIASCPRPSQHR